MSSEQTNRIDLAALVAKCEENVRKIATELARDYFSQCSIRALVAPAIQEAIEGTIKNYAVNFVAQVIQKQAQEATLMKFEPYLEGFHADNP